MRSKRLDFGVQVMHFDADFLQVVGQVLGHALGQRRHQHALAGATRLRISATRSSTWPLVGRISTCGIDQAGRADDLLDDLRRVLQLVRAGRGAWCR